MKKLTSPLSFVLFTVAVLLLVSNCGMDASQASKPPVMAGSVNGSATTANVSPSTQPIVAGGVADNGNGATAMAATNDAPQMRQPGAVPQGATAFGNAEPTEYRIAQQDIVQISVFQVNDLNTAVQVSQDGNITLPLLGKVPVAGKTTSEAEDIIAGKLKQKYLQSPQVSVSVKTYGKRITVSGEVKGARVIADDGNTTLSQAIANAGGVSDLANAERVHVAKSKDQHVQDEIYNLDDIQSGKVPDPMLHGGDIVVVEQSGVKVALKDVMSLLPFAAFATLM